MANVAAVSVEGAGCRICTCPVELRQFTWKRKNRPPKIESPTEKRAVRLSVTASKPHQMPLVFQWIPVAFDNYIKGEFREAGGVEKTCLSIQRSSSFSSL